jgi:hypothetical protein
MSTQPMISPVVDGANPFAPPTSKGEDPWTFGDPVAVAIRREHQKDEAYLKAMGILNYIYAFYFAQLFAGNVTYPILHALHRIDAPWSVQPPRFIGYALSLVLTVLAVVAGYGFRRLTRWAFRIEAILAICWLMFWFVTVFVQHWTTPLPLVEIFAILFFYLALASPMMNLLDFRRSPVLEPTYKTILKATSHIRVRAKTPLQVKLMSGFLLFCSAVAFYLSYKGR